VKRRKLAVRKEVKEQGDRKIIVRTGAGRRKRRTGGERKEQEKRKKRRRKL